MFDCTSCFVGLIVIIFIIIIMSLWNRKKKVDLTGQHIFVVGGSTGIGLAVAECVVRLGADVTIAARDSQKLNKAANDLYEMRYHSEQKINICLLDVTSSPKIIAQEIENVTRDYGPISMLFVCAGTSICGRLEDMTESDVRRLTELNYLGTVWTIQPILKQMKHRGKGSIVLVSSLAALLGVYGLSAYGATKWAVRGLGEALMMETVGTGVTITLSYPPDTDTPGFQLEETSKPIETKIISSSGGLHSPQSVATKLVYDALNGSPYSTLGFEGWILTLMTGTTSSGVLNTMLQCSLMGPIRIVLICYQYYFHYIIKKCLKEKNTNKKTQ